MSLEEQLERILASDPAAIADPFPAWRGLVAAGGTAEVDHALLVGSHRLVKPLLRESRALSNRSAFEGTRADAIRSRLTPEQLRAHAEISAFEERYVSRADGEAHTRLRGIAHQAFTPRRVAEMRSTVQRFTDELLDRMAEEETSDLASRLAYPLPLMVIADMLEVPATDRELIHDWSNRIGRNRGGDDPVALMSAHSALKEFRAYVGAMIAERRRHPGTDLVSALMEAETGERLTEEELAAMFVILFFAGHETTTNLIANGLLALQRRPDQWRLLRDDPSLAASGVEEILRFVSPVQWVQRVAADDVELGALRIERGRTVMLVIAAANRDPAAFEDPDQLDLRRADAKRHLGLGFGPHFCLGNALARLEGAVVMETLARRFPDLEVAADTIAWRGHGKLRGIAELPVRLGRERVQSSA